jgi:hypothetical protein
MEEAFDDEFIDVWVSVRLQHGHVHCPPSNNPRPGATRSRLCVCVVALKPQTPRKQHVLIVPFSPVQVRPLGALGRLAVLDIHCPLPARRQTCAALARELGKLRPTLTAVYLCSHSVAAGKNLGAPLGSSAGSGGGSGGSSSGGGGGGDALGPGGVSMLTSSSNHLAAAAEGGGGGGDSGLPSSLGGGGGSGGAGVGVGGGQTRHGLGLARGVLCGLGGGASHGKLSKGEAGVREELAVLDACAAKLRALAGLSAACAVYWTKAW